MNKLEDSDIGNMVTSPCKKKNITPKTIIKKILIATIILLFLFRKQKGIGKELKSILRKNTVI